MSDAPRKRHVTARTSFAGARVSYPAWSRRSDERSRWLVGRRPRQAGEGRLVERPQGPRLAFVNRQAIRDRYVLEKFRHADRKQRTVLAVALLLLVRTTRHVG